MVPAGALAAQAEGQYLKRADLFVTGVERHLGPDAIIVSKTDPQGRIIYANQTFLEIAGYTAAEVLGKPHNLVRHPDMPRCVFKLLWDTINSGNEIFAYVVNRSKNGDHYWVFAHVTPTFDASGAIKGYHSSRRAPTPAAIAAIKPVYAELLAEEAKHANPKEAAAAGVDLLVRKFIGVGGSYEDLVFSL
ncbi:PAS domain-containing protein [Magnetospirillum moscoviense]|uniref:PAS domain-containing protein n=1 Tax=Magnetospirillum moscoviense TaxID=1437059 RepID=UPI0009EF5791|nr:PAS domain-containing protein [Magnetospirillum moscoviense]MBF0325104.1 PAS domain-containing protein [Alphaproteobacteria bacterium]